jgi:hypothetical protein
MNTRFLKLDVFVLRRGGRYLIRWVPYKKTLAFSKVLNRVGVSPHLRMETDPLLLIISCKLSFYFGNEIP